MNLYCQSDEEASDELITQYLQEKLFNNNKKISKAFPNYWNKSDLYINGDKFNSPGAIFEKIKISHLLKIINYKKISRIHGDLTIENIIKIPNGWYLIDSADHNNIFSCKMLDFGKLFQSLHYGYEILNSTSNCNETENGLFFSDNRSLQYKELFKFLRGYLVDTYGQDSLMEILLHEIICYSRMLPYKIRLFPTKASIFFAIYVILINEFHDRYEKLETAANI